MTLRRIALLTLLPLSLAACDVKGLPGFGARSPEAAAPATDAAPTPTPAPAPSAPAVSPLDSPIEVGAGTPLGTANAETSAVKSVAASGSGWSAVASGDKASLARDGAKTLRIPVRRIDFGNGTEFAGNIGNSAFSLKITAADCGDKPMTATVRISGGATLTGCAGPATAEQVAAIAKAAPAAAPKQAAVAAPAKPKKPAAPKAAKPAAAAPAPAAPSPAPTPTPAPSAPIVIPGGPTSLPTGPVLSTSAPAFPTPTPTPTPTP